MDALVSLVVVMIVVPIVIWIFGVHREKSELRASRLDFLKWLTAGLAIEFLLPLIGGMMNFPEISILKFILFSCIAYPFAQTTVRRTRDASLDKSLAYLILVPFIGILIALVLLLKGPFPNARGSASTDG